MSNNNKIFLSPSKTNLYINKAIRATYSDLEKSKKIILSKLNLNNKKILDVGCASGDFYSVLKKKYKNINYHGIDLDDKCIQFAKKKFGNNACFDKLDIFSKKLKSKYDVVMIWNLFYMIPDWKKFLIRSSELSKKYIIFDNKIRLTGQTVIDLDLSYQYYHKSNKRNYYIVHNIHELIAFLQIHELNLNKICINGYKLPGPTSAKLPLDKKEIYVGGLILQKYDQNSKINRYGVTSESAKTSWVKISINIAK